MGVIEKDILEWIEEIRKNDLENITQKNNAYQQLLGQRKEANSQQLREQNRDARIDYEKATNPYGTTAESNAMRGFGYNTGQSREIQNNAYKVLQRKLDQNTGNYINKNNQMNQEEIGKTQEMNEAKIGAENNHQKQMLTAYAEAIARRQKEKQMALEREKWAWQKGRM